MKHRKVGVKQRSMPPEKVWRSRCLKMGWRCSRCASIPALS